MTAAISAVELWGMVGAIAGLLALVGGGAWRLGRATTTQIIATRDNTTAIGELAQRLGKLETAVRQAPAAVVKGIAENGV